ncbi:hypothetical protein L6R49_11255 [Myxococcota bacterium]|nr:hypothetical protein [Myxococcota bacterium]
MKVWTPLLVVTLTLAGCAHTPRGREAAQISALTGTTWRLVANLPDLGTVTYDVTFEPEGRLRSHSPRDTTPDDDRWALDDELLTITMNDGRIRYEFERLPDGSFAGGGFNQRGERWGVTMSQVTPG